MTAIRIFAIGLAVVLAACEASPTLPPRVQAAGRPSLSSGTASRARCRASNGRPKHPVTHSPWATRLDRLAAGQSVGIAVASGGNLVYERDAGTRRTPASNEKLFLSMALFDQLGADFRIPTIAAGPRPVAGVIPGDLWILGKGDPSLTLKEPHFWGQLQSPTLKLLAQRLRSAGISRIEGSVRGATGYFAHDFNAPGWQPYVPRDYVQLPTALSVNGNFHVKGHPERTAARSLDRQLRARGTAIAGDPGTGLPPRGLSEIAQVSSLPLSQLVAFMDRNSNNFFAEVLGKLLGADMYGPPGTIHKGAEAIRAWALRSGVHVKAYDSSGLSYWDKISPRAVVHLLAAAERRPWGLAFRRDLAAPGQGTLTGRLGGLQVHAKTGTLFNSDSALSGWVRNSASGTWLEFSILDQNMPKATEDSMVRVIARARIRVPGRKDNHRSVCGP